MSAKRPKDVKTLPDGTTIVKSSTVHGTGQMRCTHCHNMCMTTADANGNLIIYCPACKAKFTSRPM